MSADVDLQNISVTFGNFYAAKNVSVKIQEGEFFSFLGPSGCGKTTLLRAISGFLEPSDGKILIGGQDMSGIRPNKRPTSLIFQNLALFPLMSVADNIAFSLEVRGISKLERRKRADELLELIALTGQGDKKVHELSGGQKQRLAIARALAPGTNFILLDEPFCSLDMHVKLKLRSELPNILRSCNASGLMVTHDPEEAMSICDKVAVMNEGKIHQVDSPIKLLENPKTIFVSSFILGNNILNLKKEENSYSCCIGEINTSSLVGKNNIKFISIPQKFISIKSSVDGDAKIVSKEFMGEYFIYKLLLKEETLRVRTNINDDLNVGDNCFLSIDKDCFCFLYPGAHKIFI